MQTLIIMRLKMAPNVSSRFGTGRHQMGGGWRHCTWQMILASSCCPMCLMASVELSLCLSLGNRIKHCTLSVCPVSSINLKLERRRNFKFGG